MKRASGETEVQVAAVGSIGLDDIETPQARREGVLGGSLSYACAAAAFFTRVGMVGVVGDDFPSEHVKLYESLGIDLAGLKKETGRTFRWSGVYDDDMINRRTLSTELNVFAEFSPELPEAYRRARFFLLGNISPELQLHVLDQAGDAEFVVADTMDLWIRSAREPLMEVIGRVHMLTLNDSEARLLTGTHNLRDCARQLLDMGPRFVVIKKGEHGSMLLSDEGIFIAPAYPVAEVHDPTGAGDSFAGGFLGALACGRHVDERAVRRGMLYGSVVASFGVEAFGLERFRGLSMKTIDARLEELHGMIRV